MANESNMTFSKLTEYFQKLESTPKRLEITSILAELINEADATEVDKILYLTEGRLGPLFDNEDFNLGDKMIQRVLSTAYNKATEEITKQLNTAGDLGDVAEKLSNLSPLPPASPLTVIEVFDQLTTIAYASGTNSQDRKVQSLASLLRISAPVAAKYLVRIPLGKLRLGFSDLTVLDALSYTITGDKALRNQIEATYNIYPDIGQIAKVLKESGTDGLKKIKLTAGVPILPERCSLVESSVEMLERSEVWAVQPKYDGLRTQIHYGVKSANHDSLITSIPLIPLNTQTSHIKTKIYSRGLEDITATMPEIVAAAEQLANECHLSSFILDGEAVTVDPTTGKIMPFNDTVTRKRKYDIAEKSASNPLNIFVFDLLLLNGEDLTNEPYTDRYDRLSNLLHLPNISNLTNLHLTPQTVLKDAAAISALFQKDIKEGYEGIVAKKPNSTYHAGARDYSWVKLKREGDTSGLADTIDCVVMGYYAGEGKRNDFGIGAFLVGVYDPSDDTFKTLAKIGTGLTDDRWRELKAKCDQIKTTKMPTRYVTPASLSPHVWVTPRLVVSIRADQVTKSPSHSSGYSLRFPRLLDYREKLPEDANSVSDIEKLFKK
ncbi:MAG: ATP-dependent DNA ligase [candidate division WWE3 bacterium]|nr:ATP-dependent DNA ligase [candidate division WWE3 bacterium]